MSDKEVQNTTASNMKRIEKYLESGISIYSLKTTESSEEIKPYKKYSDNILEELNRESSYKLKQLKKKTKTKFLNSLSKKAKEEYDNFIMLNREKKFRSYFHDSESKSRKYCEKHCAKDFEKIKNFISIKHIESKDVYREKVSESKIQKEIKMLKDQMFITNIDKQAKLIDNIQKMSSSVKIKFGDEKPGSQIEMDRISSFAFKKPSNNNEIDKLDYIHINNSNKTDDKEFKSDSLINKNFDVKETIEMQTANNFKKIDVSNKNKKFNLRDNGNTGKSRNGFEESYVNCFLKDNSEEKSVSSNAKKKSNNQKVINIYDDYPFDSNNFYSTINFSPVCGRRNNSVNINILSNKHEDKYCSDKNLFSNKADYLKSPSIDRDNYAFQAEKKFQAKKTSMNFNKNPGLIKRGNFRFSCKNSCKVLNNNNNNNEEENDYLKEEEEEEEKEAELSRSPKNNKSNLYKDKLPFLNQDPSNQDNYRENLHRKNNSQIALKNNFLDAFNKYTNSKSSKETLISKNNIFNSPNDFESRLNQVKIMEKSEVYNRSSFKIGFFKGEKMYKCIKKENDFLMLKTKFDNFLANNKDFLKVNSNQNPFNNESKLNNENQENKCDHDYINKINSRNSLIISPSNGSNMIELQKEKVKIDLYSLKKIKNLNIFGEENPYYAEKKLDNTYGIFPNMNELKKIKHLKIKNPNYSRDKIAKNQLELRKGNSNKHRDYNVLSNPGSFTIPRTVKEHVKGYHPINNFINEREEEEKRPYLIDAYNRKKY